MKPLSVLCTVVAVLLAVLVGSASAAVQPLAPAPNAKIKSKRPTFTWTTPAGEATTVLAVSKKAATEDDGGFVDNEIFDLLDDTDTAHKIDRSLPAGKHFWSVKSQIASPFQTFWTPPQVFTITPKVSIRKPKIRRFTSIDMANFTVKWTGNLKPATVKIRVLNRKKKLFGKKQKIGFASLDAKNQAFFTWDSRGRIAQGTKLTLEMKISGAGKTFKRLATFRAP